MRLVTVSMLLAAAVFAQEAQLKQLASPSAAQRRIAAAALGAMGKDAAKAVPALVKALEDRNGLVRQQVILALGEIGDERAVDPLAALVAGPDLRTRQLAARSLGRIGGRAEPVLRAALTAKQSATRAAAALGLTELKTKTDATRAALAKAMTDSSPLVRAQAAWALLPATAARDILFQVLDQDEVESSRLAVQALGDAGARDETTARRVVKALQSKHEIVRWYAGASLRRFTAVLPAVRKDIYAALTTASFPVRAGLAGSLQPIAQDHLGELVKLLAEHDDVAPHIVLACEKCAEDAATAVVPLLAHESGAVAARAAHFFAALGKKGRPHVEALKKAVGRPEIAVRVYAARAVWELTRDAGAVYKAFEAGLTAPKAVRLLAIESLGSMGSTALDAMPGLENAAQSEDKQIARAAKVAIRRIQR